MALLVRHAQAALLACRPVPQRARAVPTALRAPTRLLEAQPASTVKLANSRVLEQQLVPTAQLERFQRHEHLLALHAKQ